MCTVHTRAAIISDVVVGVDRGGQPTGSYPILMSKLPAKYISVTVLEVEWCVHSQVASGLAPLSVLRRPAGVPVCFIGYHSG